MVEKRQEKAVKLPPNHMNGQLLHVGVLDPLKDGARFTRLTEKEVNIMQTAFKERQAKIQLHNYCVNPLRVLVRNLPLNLKEGEFLKVCRGVLNEQKGLREGVTKAIIVAGDKVKRCRGWVLTFFLLLPKFFRFGFVNFSTHELALKWLGIVNGTRLFPSSTRRVLCEFSYDDVRKLHIKNEKMKKFLEKDQENKKKQLEIKKLIKKNDTGKMGRGARQVGRAFFSSFFKWPWLELPLPNSTFSARV